MVVINADTGKVVASPPIGGDPDGNGYDPATGLLFAVCREGLLSVIQAAKGANAENLVNAIISAVAGEKEDDITVVAIRSLAT